MLTSSRDKLWSWVNGELHDNEHLKKVSNKEVDVKEAKTAYVL
jgi:quinol-cytochrome oxidoreductase complex cytochrome b subunit